jgi:hypothetical protein
LPKSELYYFSEEKYILESQNNYEESRLIAIRTPPTEQDIAELIEVINITLISRLYTIVLSSVQNAALFV